MWVPHACFVGKASTYPVTASCYPHPDSLKTKQNSGGRLSAGQGMCYYIKVRTCLFSGIPEWMNKHFALLHHRSQVHCEAFGHVVMKFGGELYRFPAGDFWRFFLFFRTVHRDVGRDLMIKYPRRHGSLRIFRNFCPKRPQER